MSERIVSSCKHVWAHFGCKKCSVYDHPVDPAVKTNLYEGYLNCSPDKFLRNMRKRQCKQIYNREISEPTFSLLQAICEKFEYSIETLALGVYLFAKSRQNNKDEKFWASTALIVASKGIELDKHVPYLNRYQRYADKSFTQQQYQVAQRTIFQDIDFDVQNTTFVSFLHFYLTSGVLFKSDSFNTAILKYIEDDMLAKARDYIRTGQFLAYEPEKLALAIVKEIRVKFRLDPWKKQLELVSGFNQSDIKMCEPVGTLKPITIHSSNQKPRDQQKQIFSQTLTQTLRFHQRQPQSQPQSQQSNPLCLSFLQNSSTLTQQRQKQKEKQKQKIKKPLESTLKFQNISLNINSSTNTSIKQNSNKILQDIPLALASLRSQIMGHGGGHGGHGGHGGNGGNGGHTSNGNSSAQVQVTGNKYALGDRLATVSSFVTNRRF